MVVRHAIVGSGIAGLSAAEAIRERDPSARIHLVSEEPHDFYSRPGLAYFLRKDVPEKQLFLRTPQELKALGVERVNDRCSAIDPRAHTLHTPRHPPLAYDRLLLATGALATPPGFPGRELDGVVKLDGLDDTRRIIALAKKARDAVVVGGGITALELAEGLNARGVRVHYLLRGERYWSDVLDEVESGIVMDRLRRERIDVRAKTQVQEARGRAGRLQSVATDRGESIPAQILAVAIGVRPRVDLAAASGLAVRKGILVDPFLATSAPDVFAAGDCAEVVDPATGQSLLDVLWPLALNQGRVAGANMTGARVRYRKATPFNLTLIAGLRVAIIGCVGGGQRNEDLLAISRGESESWRLVPRSILIEAFNQVDRVRLALGENTIVGALVMGDQKWTKPLHRLIEGRVDITPIRDALRAPHALQTLERFHRAWEDAAR